MKPEVTDIEQAELEQKLRKAVVGHRPPAPQGLLDFVEAAPASMSRRRWVRLGVPAPRVVRAFGAAAVVMVLVVAAGSTALLMSARPVSTTAPGATRSAVPSTYSAASGYVSAWPTEVESPSEAVPSAPIASPSASSSALSTAPIAPSAGPIAPSAPSTEAPNGSPSYVLAPTPNFNRTISGRVTDLGGQVLAGINVYCLSVDGQVERGSTTDASGNYSIPTEAGQYLMIFVDGSEYYTGLQPKYPPTGWLGASGFTYDKSAAIHIDVTSDNAAGVDIALPPSLKATLHVTDTAGAPLSGISCWMEGRDGEHVVSDAGGNCAFAVMPGDKIDLFTESTAYSDGRYSASSPNGYSPYENGASLLTVPDNGLTVTIALPRAVYISGTVAMSGGGALPADMTAYACGGGKCFPWAAVHSDGTYSLKAGPGTWMIMVGHWLAASIGYYSTSGLTTDPGSATPIVLSGANVKGINIVIPG